MACEELDSFYRKFKTLLIAGHNATLTLEGVAGEATATLKTTLGPVLPPSKCSNIVKQHRSPSYYRRQQKRKKLFSTPAAEQASEGETIATEEVADTVDPNVRSEAGSNLTEEAVAAKQSPSDYIEEVREDDDEPCSNRPQMFAELGKPVLAPKKPEAKEVELSRNSNRSRPVPRPNPECCNHECFPESDAPGGKCCWHRCGRNPWPWQLKS